MFLRSLALASTLSLLLTPLSAQAERVLLDTSKGMIELELDEERAPVTVANFIAYVESGFYDGLTFHRVIPGFMIQGGGLDANMQPRKTRDPIVNESTNGLSNTRGSLAMARTGIRTAPPVSFSSTQRTTRVSMACLDAPAIRYSVV